LIDFKFDTDFLGMLVQTMLGSVAFALMVAVWTDQEEWRAISLARKIAISSHGRDLVRRQ